MSRIGRYLQTKSRLLVALGWGEKLLTLSRHKISLCGDGNVLNLDYGDSCTNGKCAKSH